MVGLFTTWKENCMGPVRPVALEWEEMERQTVGDFGRISKSSKF